MHENGTSYIPIYEYIFFLSKMFETFLVIDKWALVGTIVLVTELCHLSVCFEFRFRETKDANGK